MCPGSLSWGTHRSPEQALCLTRTLTVVAGEDPVVAERPELRAALESRVLSLMEGPEFLAAAECVLGAGQAGGESREASRVRMTLRLAEELFSARPLQSRYASLLLARPILLESSLPPITLYATARFASPETALELLGAWIELHPDAEPVFTLDYYDQNRRRYRNVCQLLAWQYPPHAEALQERYLAASDGSCRLSAAYVLAYCYVSRGRIAQWIDELDARLAKAELTGDRRVNWLLARAQAEEIRQSRPGQHFKTQDRFLAGRRWIAEAAEAAQSEAVRLRVCQELAARLASQEQLDAAREVIEAAQGSLSSSSSAEALAGWGREIDAPGRRAGLHRQQQAELADEAYRQRLGDRYRRAAQANDQGAMARYKDLIGQAGGQVP